MFFLQECQHVHLLWLKKYLALVWKPNPPALSPLCAPSSLCWHGEYKPGSTPEPLTLKAPLVTWSVKFDSCYNLQRALYEADSLEHRRPCTCTSATTSNFNSRTRDGYRLHFTDIDTAYRYQYLSIRLSILFGAKIYDVKSCWKFQVILLLLNLSNCIKVLQSVAGSYFSLCVLFY